MVRARTYLLGIALALTLAANPASALGGTIANGNYTAAPGEQNNLLVAYIPGTDSYTYAEGGAGITDGDGAGGCTVSFNQATCPAAIVSHINISLLDGDDQASLTLIGSGPALTPSVTIPATIDGGDGNDLIRGGAGNDVISGGPGIDNLLGFGGDDTLLGGEGSDYLDIGGLSIAGLSPAAGADRLDGGPGADFGIIGIEALLYAGPMPVGLDPAAQRPDVITCGTGGERSIDVDKPPPGPGLVDTALPGPGDEVGSDCETVSQWAFCPAGGKTCVGTVTVEATAKGGTSAAASAKKNKGRKVILGRGPLYGRAGNATLVGVTLNRKNLTRVLRGRQKVPAQSVVRLQTGKKKGKKSGVAREAKKKSRVIGRTRFVFTKG